MNNVEELAAAIGCKVGSLPTMYLGLPLGAPYRSTGCLGRSGGVNEEKFG